MAKDIVTHSSVCRCRTRTCQLCGLSVLDDDDDDDDDDDNDDDGDDVDEQLTDDWNAVRLRVLPVEATDAERFDVVCQMRRHGSDDVTAVAFCRVPHALTVVRRV